MIQNNILFVIESLGGGGAEKVLTTILKHIDKSRYNVTLCTIVDTGKYVEEIKQYVNYKSIISYKNTQSIIGKILYYIKYKLVYSLLPMKLVYKLFIPKNNDIEIAFCEGFATKLLSHSSNKKAIKISWVHIDLKFNPWPQKLGIYNNIEEESKAYDKYNKIITVSKTVESSFKEIYGLDAKVMTIYNPIDVFDIRQKGAESIDCIDSNTINLITIGRLVPQKGYDILLKVIKRLKIDGYKFVLRILGEGEQYNELKDCIQQNDLEDYVKLLGFKNNPYPYIAKSNLFICSSRSEGYSLVIAESLVLGVPVISTYCSGPNELLCEGKYGKLVENGEKGEGLYNGLKQLLDNKTLLVEYRKKAIERGDYFSLKSIMNEIEKLLD